MTFTLGNRPSRTHGQEKQATESDFIIWGLLPSGVAAIAFTLLMAVSIVHKDEYQQQLVAKYPAWASYGLSWQQRVSGGLRLVNELRAQASAQSEG